MNRIRPRRGITLIEVVVSATILVVVMVVGFSVMRTNAEAGKQLSNQAWANNEAQRVSDLVARELRGGVLDVDASTFCGAPGENFCVIVTEPILGYDDTSWSGGGAMTVVTDAPVTYDVVDATGATMPVTATGTGRLRRTQGGYSAIVARDVERFCAEDPGTSRTLDLTVAVERELGGSISGRRESVTATVETQVRVNR